MSDPVHTCDNCGGSLVSFSEEKLRDGRCPFCKGRYEATEADDD